MSIVKRQTYRQRIVLLGPQGSGKGTQADILSTKLGLPHISTGDIFRRHINHRTAVGRKLSTRLRVGKLAPDALTNKLVAERLRSSDCRRGFILDGYPRTLNQARWLQRVARPDLVIVLELSDRQAVKRLSGRRMALDGKIYHLRYHQAPKRLRATLLIRDDDRPAAVQRRLRLYRRLTAPILRFYDRQGVLKKVDGQPPIPAVTRAILRVGQLFFARLGNRRQ